MFVYIIRSISAFTPTLLIALTHAFISEHTSASITTSRMPKEDQVIHFYIIIFYDASRERKERILSKRKFFIAQMGSKNETLAITFQIFKVNVFCVFNNSGYVYGFSIVLIGG